MDKKIIIDHIYYNIGKQYTDFRLCYTKNSNNTPIFSKWRYYLEVQDTDWFINRVNQREILQNELILDLDDGTYGDYLRLIKQLNMDGFKFHAFATKSGRARHIHIFDNKLIKLEKLRTEVKEFIINKYGCDNQLKIDHHMIPLEFCRHWKTGEIKDLIYTNRGDWFDSF